MDSNTKCFALRDTELSLDFMRDSTYFVWACTWEMVERVVTTNSTPAAVAEIILTAVKNYDLTYSIVIKISVDRMQKERGAYQHVVKYKVGKR